MTIRARNSVDRLMFHVKQRSDSRTGEPSAEQYWILNTHCVPAEDQWERQIDSQPVRNHGLQTKAPWVGEQLLDRHPR